jgi:hypothetical protein
MDRSIRVDSAGTRFSLVDQARVFVVAGKP